MAFDLPVEEVDMADFGQPLRQRASDHVWWLVEIAETEDLTFCRTIHGLANIPRFTDSLT